MFEVKRVATKEQLDEAFRIRTAVFVEEQGVPPEEEIDAYEREADHIVVYSGTEPVATGRLRMVDGAAKLERICVLADYRKHGLGGMIMNALETIAREKGAATAKLHGQTQAERFYEKLGYRTVSGIFMDAGIPHVRMIKDLRSETARF